MQRIFGLGYEPESNQDQPSVNCPSLAGVAKRTPRSASDVTVEPATITWSQTVACMLRLNAVRSATWC